MYILGDIGNTETKIFLVSINNKIIKKLNFLTQDISNSKLDKFFISSKIDYKKLKKILLELNQNLGLRVTMIKNICTKVFLIAVSKRPLQSQMM